MLQYLPFIPYSLHRLQTRSAYRRARCHMQVVCAYPFTLHHPKTKGADIANLACYISRTYLCMHDNRLLVEAIEYKTTPNQRNRGDTMRQVETLPTSGRTDKPHDWRISTRYLCSDCLTSSQPPTSKSLPMSTMSTPSPGLTSGRFIASGRSNHRSSRMHRAGWA
jgi:hypothetical protein